MLVRGAGDCVGSHYEEWDRCDGVCDVAVEGQL